MERTYYFLEKRNFTKSLMTGKISMTGVPVTYSVNNGIVTFKQGDKEISVDYLSERTLFNKKFSTQYGEITIPEILEVNYPQGRVLMVPVGSI